MTCSRWHFQSHGVCCHFSPMTHLATSTHLSVVLLCITHFLSLHGVLWSWVFSLYDFTQCVSYACDFFLLPRKRNRWLLHWCTHFGVYIFSNCDLCDCLFKSAASIVEAREFVATFSTSHYYYYSYCGVSRIIVSLTLVKPWRHFHSYNNWCFVSHLVTGNTVFFPCMTF